MIAMDTVRLTAATIAARLSAAGPGALASCICAQSGSRRARGRQRAQQVVMSRGMSRMAPIRSSAMAR